MRRGAAWPAERPSSWLVVREAVSRRQVAHRRAVMVAKRRRRCPQDTVGWPSARPLGMVALEVRMPAVPSSACRCPRPASGVQCLVRVSISTHACPRGRCPVSSVGVRCPWVPASTVSGREVVEGGGGQAAAWLGWPASAWSPALSTASSSSARVGAWRSRLAQAVLVSGGVGLDLAVVVGRCFGQWPGRPRGRQYTPAREDRSSVRSRARSEVRLLRQAARHVTPAPLLRARPGSCTYPRRRTRHRIRHKAQRERNDILAQIGGGDYAAWSSCEA